MKGPHMKTTNRKTLFVTGLCALALSLGFTAYAEKGAETLVRLTRGAAPTRTEVAPVRANKYPTCTDPLVTVEDNGTKAPNHLATKVARHNCAGCDTKIVTEGTGKANRNVVIHKCNGDTKPLCCAMN